MQVLVKGQVLLSAREAKALRERCGVRLEDLHTVLGYHGRPCTDAGYDADVREVKAWEDGRIPVPLDLHMRLHRYVDTIAELDALAS